MALGKPSITTLRALAVGTNGQVDVRGLQQVIDNIRERFRASDAEVDRLQRLVAANKSFEELALLKQQVAALAEQVKALNVAPDVAELAELLAGGDGIVVVKDGQLIVRSLEPGAGVVITWPDGAGGNPIIALAALVVPGFALPVDGWDWFGEESPAAELFA